MKNVSKTVSHSGRIRSTRKLQLVHSDVCGPMQTQSIRGAKSSDHAAEWKVATDAEYNSLIEKTWKLVELPPGRKAIGCKWLFKLKHDVDDRVERFKARLVAKGVSR